MEKDNSLQKDLENISKIISGELALKNREEKLKKLKKEAIEKQKDSKRFEIIKGRVALEDDSSQPKKVVQNIKLFQWEANDRYEFGFDNKTFITIVALSLVLILFLAILGHYLLMLSIIALLFFIYVLSTTKPIKVKHKITARGIDTGDKLYEWYMFNDFYFTKKDKQNFLIVNTKLRFPGALILLLSEKDRLPLFLLLQEFVLYKDIRKQRKLDKINFGEYIPLEEI
jgi:hypothetical protein